MTTWNAVKNGPFSDPATFGVATTNLAAGDIVDPKSYLVTVDQDILTPITFYRTGAGQIVVSDVPETGRVIRANIEVYSTSSNGCIILNAVSGGAVHIISDHWTTYTGTFGGNSKIIDIGCTTDVVIDIANAFVAKAAYDAAVYIAASCNISINGRLVNGGAIPVKLGGGSPKVTITDLQGGVTTNAYGMTIANGCTATVKITEKLTAGGGATAHGINAPYAGSIFDLQGSASASAVAHAIYAPLTTSRIRIGGRMSYGPTGMAPVFAQYVNVPSAHEVVWDLVDDAPTPGTVTVSNRTGFQPDPEDVVMGVLYGDGNSNVGTYRTVSEDKVSAGVQFGNGQVGTAALILDDVQSIIDAAKAETLADVDGTRAGILSALDSHTTTVTDSQGALTSLVTSAQTAITDGQTANTATITAAITAAIIAVARNTGALLKGALNR